MITILVMISIVSSTTLFQPVNGKGLDEGFLGREYLETSWVTLLGKEIIGTPTLTDLDWDGNKEVLIASAHNLFCINSDGTLRWSKSTKQTLKGNIVTGDFDEDGLLDIIITAISSIICFNTYGIELWEYTTDYYVEDFTPCVFDINGDMHLDILVSTAKTPSQPFLISHDGKFIKNFDIDMDYSGFWSGDFGGAPTIVDLDNDGDLEILFIGNDYKLHCISLQGEQKWIADPIIRADALFSIADLDNDTTLEICIGSTIKLYCFDHEGNIEWTYQQKHANNRNNLMDYNPCIADLDNNGKLEIVSSSYDWETGEGQIFCLNSTGGKIWNRNSTSRVSSPAVLDIDNNGRLEILFIDSKKYFSILDPLGQLLVYRDLDSIVDEPPLVADIDQDSKLEAIIARPGKKDLYCFEFAKSTNSTDSWWTRGGSNLHHGRADSDGDFLDDLIETNYYHTNNHNNDTDNDLLPDYWEIEYGLNPLEPSTNQDPDGDRFTNLEEFMSHTNPRRFNNWTLFYGIYFLPLWILTAGILVLGLVKIKTISSVIKRIATNFYVYLRVKFAHDIRFEKEIFQDDEFLSDFEKDLKNEE